MICLDTNAAIAVLAGGVSPVRLRFEECLATGGLIAVSSIVMFELWYGAAGSKQIEGNARKLDAFLSAPVIVLDFDTADAEEAGRIRADLRRAGTPIGPYDVLIGAQARRRGAVLVTANHREFRRIEGLRIENWLE